MAKVNQNSVTILAIALALILVMLGITASGLMDVQGYIIPTVKMAGVLIVFSEIGLMMIVKSRGKKTGLITAIELIVASLIAIETIIGFILGTSILSWLSAWFLIAFGIVFVVETLIK